MFQLSCAGPSAGPIDQLHMFCHHKDCLLVLMVYHHQDSCCNIALMFHRGIGQDKTVTLSRLLLTIIELVQHMLPIHQWRDPHMCVGREGRGFACLLILVQPT